MMADLHLALSTPSALVQSVYQALDRSQALEPAESISAAFKSLFPTPLALQQVSTLPRRINASTDRTHHSRFQSCPQTRSSAPSLDSPPWSRTLVSPQKSSNPAPPHRKACNILSSLAWNSRNPSGHFSLLATTHPDFPLCTTERNSAIRERL